MFMLGFLFFFFFQAEDGIRDLVRSRGLGDVYKRQDHIHAACGAFRLGGIIVGLAGVGHAAQRKGNGSGCLLYTSDAADDLLCVDLGGRRIIKKKKNLNSFVNIHREQKIY